jgi:hypothetical protein
MKKQVRRAMLKIELIPDLSHCIETVAKREHTQISKQLLKSGEGNKELEEKLEVLGTFLETADFRKLRAESEKILMDGKNVKFVVYRDKSVKWEIQVA